MTDSPPIPGSAERPLGDSSVHRGWYSRGYLPHRDHPGLLQAITYRLADSLPTAALEDIRFALQTIPPHRQDSERRRHAERWLDAGHGSCVLGDPRVAGCIVENWRRYACIRYDLIAWVVMPNHVHVLIRAYDGVPLGKIVQAWKGYTGRRIAEQTLGAPKSPSSTRAANRVWMREYWDRFIRNEVHFRHAVTYIHENPVKAGLATRAEDWPWSSAREYIEHPSSLAPPG